MISQSHLFIFFFFNDTATTEIYTLSLHDALPIWQGCALHSLALLLLGPLCARLRSSRDRKSTRLNSSDSQISYAVFCLKKKKKNIDKAFMHRIDFNSHFIVQHKLTGLVIITSQLM